MREGYKLVYSKANVVMIIERFVGQKTFLDATIHIFENYSAHGGALIKIRGLPVSDQGSEAQRNILKYLATKGIEIEANCNVVGYEFVLTSGSYRYSRTYGEGKPTAEFFPSEEESSQRENWLAKLFMKK